MKIFYLALLLLSVGHVSNAQQTRKPYGYKRLPLVENKVVYTGVVVAPCISQQVLFERARQWLAQTIISGPDTARTRNREAGMLVAHGLLNQPPIGAFKDPNSYTYDCTIYVRDGKYKYQIDRFQWAYSTMTLTGTVARGPFTSPLEQLGTLPNNYYTEDRAGYVDEQMKALISSLEATLAPHSAADLTW